MVQEKFITSTNKLKCDKNNTKEQFDKIQQKLEK